MRVGDGSELTADTVLSVEGFWVDWASHANEPLLADEWDSLVSVVTVLAVSAFPGAEFAWQHAFLALANDNSVVLDTTGDSGELWGFNVVASVVWHGGGAV